MKKLFWTAPRRSAEGEFASQFNENPIDVYQKDHAREAWAEIDCVDGRRVISLVY